MSAQLTIGIVANTAFNIYNFRLGLIKALQAEGYRVLAIAPQDEYVAMLIEEGVEFVELKKLARKGTNPFNDFMLMNELRSIYQINKIDAALQYTIKPNIYGTLAARLTGTKTICTVTGLGYTFLNKSTAGKVAHALYRFAFSFADKVLFQNVDDLEVFVQNKLVRRKKTLLVPGSGIDTQKFSPEYCPPKNTVSATVHFLMIGRLLKDKGIYEYIAAATKMREEGINAAFHLLGDIDPDNPATIRQAELDAWIQEGIVCYEGYAKDIRPFICEADCLVLPSYREGMPRVILEGMAMGKPCITSDAPGCKDAVVDGQTGFICKAENSDSLYEMLKKFVLSDIKTRVLFGKNARERAEVLFSTEKISKIYIKILRNL